MAGRRITGKLSGHPTQRMRARRPRSRRGASSHPSCSARRHCPCRCGSAVPLRVSSVKHPIVNKDEPRMDTNGHECQWTCLAATPSREEGRERGRPARTTLAQLHPSPPPGSTGNGATIPLRPSPWGSGRQGGRAPHHGETERPPNPENAGETPALPEGRLLPSFLLREEALPLTMRQSRSASCVFSETPHRQSRRTTKEHEWTRMPVDLPGCDAVTGGRPGARASRPHNAGTTSPLSSTRLDRQRRHDSASAKPRPFLPAGWPGAASRGNGAAAQPRECGRDARAPGGAPPPILPARRGGTAPADAAVPSRFVCLQ